MATSNHGDQLILSMFFLVLILSTTFVPNFKFIAYANVEIWPRAKKVQPVNQTSCIINFASTTYRLDYFIVRIKIKSRKRVGDISGRADRGISHGIFRKYVSFLLFLAPLNGQITQRFLFLT